MIVLRTLSKSFSLAGLRVGLAFAAPPIIEGLAKVKDSYNLDRVAQAAAVAALGDIAWMEANATKIKATRARLIESLGRLGLRAERSESNFVLATVESPPAPMNAAAIKAELQARGVLVRWFNEEGLRDSLRITVGTDEEIDVLLGQLESIMKPEV